MNQRFADVYLSGGSPIGRHLQLRSPLKTGASVVVGGLALSVPGALAVGRMLQSGVFRLDARDFVTLVVTVAVLVTVALTASIIPARRATRLEPTTALRIE